VTERRIALVTGATAGIGAAFARELAAEGYELILVARGEKRLRALAAQLPGPAEALVADLATAAGCDAVAARLTAAGRPVDLLVNNAGRSLNRTFLSSSVELEEELLRLNVNAVMRLTLAALPGMVERGRGGIVNVSSVAGFAALMPGSTYPASTRPDGQRARLEVQARGPRHPPRAARAAVPGVPGRPGTHRTRGALTA
jgi:uncharacterized protein